MTKRLLPLLTLLVALCGPAYAITTASLQMAKYPGKQPVYDDDFVVNTTSNTLTIAGNEVITTATIGTYAASTDTLQMVTDRGATTTGTIEAATYTEGGVGIPNLNQITGTSPIVAATVGSSRALSLDTTALSSTLVTAGFVTTSTLSSALTVKSANPFRLNSVAGGLELEGIGGTWDLSGQQELVFNPGTNPTGMIKIYGPTVGLPIPSGTDLHPIIFYSDAGATEQAGISSVGAFEDYATDDIAGLLGVRIRHDITAKSAVDPTNIYAQLIASTGMLKARGTDVDDYWGTLTGLYNGGIVGDIIASNTDLHAHDTVYGEQGIVVGFGRQNHSHDGSLWVESAGTDGVPAPDVQELKVYTDSWGSHFENHSGFNEGIDATQFWFDDFINASGFIGDASGLTSIPAGNLTGSIADARLSSNVPLKNATNTFSVDQTISGAVAVGAATGTTDGHVYIKTSTANQADIYTAGADMRFDLPAAGQMQVRATGSIGMSAAATGGTNSQAYQFLFGTGTANCLSRWGMSTGVSGTTSQSDYFSVSTGNNVVQMFATPTGADTSLQIFNSDATRVMNAAIEGRLAIGTTSAPTSGAYVQTPSVAIASGTTILGHLSGTGTTDIGNTANGVSANFTITVTGAATGDTVVLGPPSTLPTGWVCSGTVTASNTVTVTAANFTGGSSDPASATYRADVWKH